MSELTFKKLRAVNQQRAIEWCGHAPTLQDLEFCTIELGGETGEFQNLVKKLMRFDKGMRGGISLINVLQPLADELADIIICADRAAHSLGLDLDEAVMHKFNETSIKQKLQTKI